DDDQREQEAERRQFRQERSRASSRRLGNVIAGIDIAVIFSSFIVHAPNVISVMSRSLVASGPGVSPVTTPSRSVMMRSAIDMSSGSSEEMTMTATPSAAS